MRIQPGGPLLTIRNGSNDRNQQEFISHGSNINSSNPIPVNITNQNSPPNKPFLKLVKQRSSGSGSADVMINPLESPQPMTTMIHVATSLSNSKNNDPSLILQTSETSGEVIPSLIRSRNPSAATVGRETSLSSKGSLELPIRHDDFLGVSLNASSTSNSKGIKSSPLSQRRTDHTSDQENLTGSNQSLRKSSSGKFLDSYHSNGDSNRAEQQKSSLENISSSKNQKSSSNVIAPFTASTQKTLENQKSRSGVSLDVNYLKSSKPEEHDGKENVLLTPTKITGSTEMLALSASILLEKLSAEHLPSANIESTEKRSEENLQISETLKENIETSSQSSNLHHQVLDKIAKELQKEESKVSMGGEGNGSKGLSRDDPLSSSALSDTLQTTASVTELIRIAREKVALGTEEPSVKMLSNGIILQNKKINRINPSSETSPSSNIANSPNPAMTDPLLQTTAQTTSPHTENPQDTSAVESEIIGLNDRPLVTIPGIQESIGIIFNFKSFFKQLRGIADNPYDKKYLTPDPRKKPYVSKKNKGQLERGVRRLSKTTRHSVDRISVALKEGGRWTNAFNRTFKTSINIPSAKSQEFLQQSMTLPKPTNVVPLPAEIEASDSLQAAIYYHEHDFLDVAGHYLSLSAEAGNPIGLYLYAMARRHGMGCEVNKRLAFICFLKSIEAAVTTPIGPSAVAALRTLPRVESIRNISAASRGQSFKSLPRIGQSDNNNNNNNNGSNTSNTTSTSTSSQHLASIHTSNSLLPVLSQAHLTETINVAQSLLALPTYEIGICFRQGWGCIRSKSTAAYFFSIAASLGDAEAQEELGYCYLRGLGVERDRNLASRWFRQANRNGRRLVGENWIWKEKFK